MYRTNTTILLSITIIPRMYYNTQIHYIIHNSLKHPEYTTIPRIPHNTANTLQYPEYTTIPRMPHNTQNAPQYPECPTIPRMPHITQNAPPGTPDRV